MPKVVDHDAYRQELAGKAVDVFIAHGYHGLGMRGIAEAIGVSKSALYHYFPSKQELFAACTELVTQPNNLYGKPVEEARSSAKDEAITSMLTVLDEQFQGEMFLLLDYIRGKSAGDVANDPLMQMANTRYLNELANTIGDSNADQACALILGGLMMRLLNGQQTDLKDIASWIMALDQ